MILDSKDIIYILIYIVSIISVFFAFRNRQSHIERELARNQKVLFNEHGFPNLIDLKTCKEHRDQVFMTIRRSENILDQVLKKIDIMNENVLTLKAEIRLKEIKLLPSIEKMHEDQ